MSSFGEFVGFFRNVEKRYFAGFVWYVEFFFGLLDYIQMVVVLNFSEQMGDTRWAVILQFGHHPRVGFESQNNLCGDLLVGHVSWAEVCQ